MQDDLKHEVKKRRLIRDTRKFSDKVKAWLERRDNVALFMICVCSVSFILPRLPMALPILLEPLFIFGMVIGTVAYFIRKKKGLPLCFPQSSGLIDPNEIDLKTKKPTNAAGIVYLGQELSTGEEIWESDSMLRTHLMFLGTTGSGKALSDRSLVLTTNGWRKMGDIIVGDVLVLPSGRLTTVKGVFPQGRKMMFKLQLENGLASECCDEHLWSIRSENEDRVASTAEIISLLEKSITVELPTTKITAECSGLNASEPTWSKITSIKECGNQRATCILVDSAEHLFIAGDFNGDLNSGIVTHNTEFLLSVVFNALIHGSGFIYVDGKADSSLYGKIYSMARKMGREDSVRVINFQTGAKDIFGPQSTKMSNTMNVFSVGSSGMLTNLVVSLMSTGKGDVWENRAISFVEALMKPFVFLRDNYGILLDVVFIRDYFELKRLEDLAWKDEDKYPGLGESLGGLRSYLDNLPGYVRNKHHNQAETVLEQHGFITMQLVRTFNSLADTYGYIMKTPLAEIDFIDVFLNRRILVVLLPALEKSPSELQNLGKIIVASIKATMAVGLGSRLEGPWAKILDSKPTTAPSPFMCVLDEYGYYSVEGFAVVPAQARSLGFSAIFAGQDLPAFQKSSEKEADSTLANTNTKLCGKLICVKTAKFFTDYSGQGYFTRAGGYELNTEIEGGFKDTNTASIEKLDRVTLDDLMGQETGKWTLWFGPKIIKLKSFFSNPTKVPLLRVTRMLRVARPNPEEVKHYRKINRLFIETLHDQQGISSRIDPPPVYDFIVVSDVIKDSENTGLELAIEILNRYSQDAQDRINSFNLITQRSLHGRPDDFEQEINDNCSDSEQNQKTSAIETMQDYDLDDLDDEVIQTQEDFDIENESPLSWMRQTKFDQEEHKSNMLSPESADLDPITRATVYGVEPVENLDDKFNRVRFTKKVANPAQGQLDKGETEYGIEQIEKIFGATDDESAFNASVVSGKISETTKYPITAPSDVTTVDDFRNIIHQFTSSLNPAETIDEYLDK